jgi:hypothetical protein
MAYIVRENASEDSSFGRWVADPLTRSCCLKNLLEAFMKKRVQTFSLVSAVIMFLSVGIALNAQQTTPQSQPADPQAQPAPATPEQAQPNQTPSQTPDTAEQPAPDAQAQSAQRAGVQSFTGTIVKSGDKYVLQDTSTGNTYDIDHQDEVQKYEGKKVKVHGTLDASGKIIRLQ